MKSWDEFYSVINELRKIENPIEDDDTTLVLIKTELNNNEFISKLQNLTSNTLEKALKEKVRDKQNKTKFFISLISNLKLITARLFSFNHESVKEKNK